MSGQDPNRNRACTDSRNISGDALPSGNQGLGEGRRCNRYLTEEGHPGAPSFCESLRISDVADRETVWWYYYWV